MAYSAKKTGEGFGSGGLTNQKLVDFLEGRIDKLTKNEIIDFVRDNFTGQQKDKMWIKLYGMGKIRYKDIPKHLRLQQLHGEVQIPKRGK